MSRAERGYLVMLIIGVAGFVGPEMIIPKFIYAIQMFIFAWMFVFSKETNNGKETS